MAITIKFQSTLPARGATLLSAGSTRPFDLISIHAPRTGSDARSGMYHVPENLFQSTLPARGATCKPVSAELCDLYFNPRSPHGERQAVRLSYPRRTGYFNPRSPHGERHGDLLMADVDVEISIHAPRTGSDCFITSSASP